MTRPTITNTERRFLHMLDDYISEQFHAAPKDQADAAILAGIQADVAEKVKARFLRRFPPIMGAC
jgi:hypothetical protein